MLKSLSRWFQSLLPASTPNPRAYRQFMRGFDAGSVSRLNASWATLNTSIDADARNSLTALRARSRHLAQNDAYMRRFVQLAKTHIVGPNGIALQMHVQDAATNKPDTIADKKIEAAWAKWSQRQFCDITGKQSLPAIQRQVVASTLVDGECFVRLITVNDSPFPLKLQVLEADWVDERKNEILNNGNRVVMGVELDPYGKPVAYYLHTVHPSDYQYGQRASTKHERVPATELFHFFDPIRPQQTRGIPWAYAAMANLKQLSGFIEAALVNARASACKMGFIEQNENGDAYTGETQDDVGNYAETTEPGTVQTLPYGAKFHAYDPQYPNGEFQHFIKSTLRGVASGLGVAYNNMANDLEGVNFSSIRAGTLEERDQWIVLQNWLIESFCQPVFEAWLPKAMLTQAVALPLRKLDNFKAATWQGRRWQWVDPLKDMEANQLAIQMGTKTPDDVIRESGRDPQDVLASLKASKEAYVANGLGEVWQFIYAPKAHLIPKGTPDAP